MEIRVGIQSGVVASDGSDELVGHTLEPRRTCTDGYQWPVPKCASMKSAIVLCGMSNERSRVKKRMSAYLHASGKMWARNIYLCACHLAHDGLFSVCESCERNKACRTCRYMYYRGTWACSTSHWTKRPFAMRTRRWVPHSHLPRLFQHHLNVHH